MSLEIVQIIEDDPLQAKLLDHSLRQARYRTNVAGDGVTGLADVQRLTPSVVLLDLMLPGMSGQEVCRRIRSTPSTQDTPIVMLTALTSEEDRVAGIELGADDYLVKPYSPREVVSRVGALLRRARHHANEDPESRDASISIEARCLVIKHCGKQLTVSHQEWQLLHLLVRRPGRIVAVEELASIIWEDSQFLRHRELEALIRGLKIKLENNLAGGIEIISTVGYRYFPPPSSQQTVTSS